MNILKLFNKLICITASLVIFIQVPYALASQNSLKCHDLLSMQKELKSKSLLQQFDEAVAKGLIDLNQPATIIVDAYSSANLFAPEFKAHGLQRIHVHSIPDSEIPIDFISRSFKTEDFNLDLYNIDPLTHQSRISEIVEITKRFSGRNFKAVVTGADWSVLFADQLSAAVNKELPWVRTDGVDEVRKKKNLQQQRLQEKGIEYVQYALLKNAQEAIAWTKEKGYFDKEPFSVVLKPNDGAGTIGFYLCRSNAEIKQAFKEIQKLQSKNNPYVLVQEFIPGEKEYSVNFTSVDGHHVLSDMWEYGKRPSGEGGHSMVYSYTTLLPYDGALQRELEAYGRKVIDALGARNGNSHVEVKYVPGRGFVLIEHNDRMIGARFPLLANQALGRGQVDLTVQSIKRPKIFKKLSSEYTRKKYVSYWVLVSFHSGKHLKSNIRDILMHEIPAFHDLSLNYKAGELVRLGVDLDSAIGGVTLMSNSEQELNDSLRRLEILESLGVFTE